jgi:hypothetical protein
MATEKQQDNWIKEGRGPRMVIRSVIVSRWIEICKIESRCNTHQKGITAA